MPNEEALNSAGSVGCRSFAGNTCLLVLSTGIAIAAFLCGDRVYSDRVVRKNFPHGGNTCIIFHEARHHAMMRDCRGELMWGTTRIPVFTNNLGLRDAEVRKVPRDSGDRPRVLFIGDSFTFGYSPWAESFVGIVSAEIPQLDVLNGGIASYSPSTYYLLAKDLLERGVQVDDVIVFIDISDIQDEAITYTDISEDKVGYRSPYTPQRTAYSRMRTQIASRWLLTNTVYTFIEHILVNLGMFWLPREEDAFDSVRGGWTYRHEASPAGYAPLGIEGGIKRAVAKMDLLFGLLHARGIPLSVTVYPWPMQLVHEGPRSRQVRLWEEWCRGKCKRFIDVYPDFHAEVEKCSWLFPGCWYDKLFVFGDVHFSAYGNALVAWRVMKELTRNSPTRKESLP